MGINSNLKELLVQSGGLNREIGYFPHNVYIFIFVDAASLKNDV